MSYPQIPETPEGFELKAVLMTTFDLDMASLRQLLPSEAMYEKLIVFRGDGTFCDSSEDEPVSPSLKERVIKAAWRAENGKPSALLHAKVWLFEYENNEQISKWHLIIHSANIFPYDNLETELHFEGSMSDQPQPESSVLCGFFSSLLSFIEESDSQKRELLTGVIRRLSLVRFVPCAPAASEVLQKAAFSCPDYSLIGPCCHDFPFLTDTYDELLIVSPFLSSALLSEIMTHGTKGSRCIVLTNADTAAGLLRDGIEGVHWLLPKDGDPFVHAKLFLIRKKTEWHLYGGSMNLTEFAVNSNMEFMVHLDVSSFISEIPSFLAAFCQRDEAEIRRQLDQYDCLAVSAENSAFAQAKKTENRISYLRRILETAKYTGEERNEAVRFLLSHECVDLLERFEKEETLPFVPLRRTITVNEKPRDVFTLDLKEMAALGLLNQMVHLYDSLFCENVFLHIKGRRPTDVFVKIRNHPDFSELYLFRTDIHAFDPSMRADVLIPALRRLLVCDTSLCAFLERLVSAGAYRLEPDGEIFRGGPGQMTGLPLGGFLENVYLQDFDEAIEKCADFYVRCGDDILLGAKSEEEIVRLSRMVQRLLENKHLTLSETKTMLLKPSEQFLFMGWKVRGNTVDFSDQALTKIRNRIRLKTRSLLEQYQKAGIEPALRLPSLIRNVNKAVNASGIHASFRIITTDESLKKIDAMLTDAIRIISSGKRGKGKYRVSYQTIRAWGFHSLVSRYYRHLETD